MLSSVHGHISPENTDPLGSDKIQRCKGKLVYMRLRTKLEVNQLM